MGAISLMFWSMMIVVTLKYVTIIMRADNKGEGGSLALLALISGRAGQKRWTAGIVLLGVFATALFYGDSMITPAVSVLSAVEGIAIAAPSFTGLVIPIAVVILVLLFAIQRTGTARVGALFGPIMLIYFTVIATLGVVSIAQNPRVLWALSPTHAVEFFSLNPMQAFLALGSIVLAVTGAEALYADMGHFGRNPIRVSWLFFVLPALILNYMGQGALLIRMGHAALESPFYMLAPDSLQLPLVILATMAAIIASQAVISGAFSVTQQAIQLGFIPRLRIDHTNARDAGPDLYPAGQLGADDHGHPAGDLLPDLVESHCRLWHRGDGRDADRQLLLAVVLSVLWQWKRRYSYPLLALFFLVDGAYFSANLTKVPDGGWFPLLVGLIVFTLLTTWAKGRKLMIDRLREAAMPIKIFIDSAANSASRVPGTAVFMTSTPEGVPHALLHNLKHNRCSTSA